MVDETVKLFENDELNSDAYHGMVTRLGEIFTQSGDAGGGTGDYSLFKDLQDVKERYKDPVQIGEGGMKKIYRVFDRLTDREVALAIIHNLSGTQIAEQFIIEARITARLEHPNIMPIYDFGLDEKGEPFFTMKLIRGETLGDIFKKLKAKDPEYEKNYPLGVLLEIFEKVCDAVAYAHHKGVLHLDLKPDNVQVGEFGEVLVCDWGISRYHEVLIVDEPPLKQKTGSLTNIGKINGSPGYMPPEQIVKSRQELSAISDIYPLGCILYEMITHQLPIRKSSVKQMLEDTVNDRIIPFSEVASGKNIPSSLEAVCLKAMAYDTSDRYASAEELKSEIMAFRGGFATRAENASFLKNIFLVINRHKALSGTILSALSLIVVITVWAFISVNEKRKEAEQNFRDLKKAKMEVEIRKTQAENRLAELTEIKKNEVAPVRREEARQLYQTFNFKAAYESISEAMALDPDNLNLYNLMGFMNLGERKFSDAKECFSRSNNPGALKYINFCDKVISLTESKDSKMLEDQALELVKMLYEDGSTPALGLFLINEGNERSGLNAKLEFSYKIISILNPLEKKISMDCVISKDKNKVDISLKGNPNLSDINGLIFLPAHSLNLSGTNVSDLSPLRQMPVESLDISETLVNDLEPISGSKITFLDISSSNINSLESLVLPEIERIVLKNLEIKDLEPLKNFPKLKQIVIGETNFNKISLEKVKLSETVKIMWVKNEY